ncbi:hypothetical protein E3U23_13655 [Erythrobacter litoralis]|uniref:hypothetical protein n=1 Tax=Erythrobacter litoralis TaxID=39960 RepID=UPI00243492EC|nr:hypothetical protein [Erythrobacter litoralis]MDG6080235.1 hypothetical protein [Erythrobacter litoralis]
MECAVSRKAAGDVDPAAICAIFVGTLGSTPAASDVQAIEISMLTAFAASVDLRGRQGTSLAKLNFDSPDRPIGTEQWRRFAANVADYLSAS